MLAEATRRGWLRAQIVSGRLAFTGRNIPGQTTEKERLSVRVVDGKVGADYEITTDKEALRIWIIRGTDLRMRRSPEGESGPVEVEFRQPADGPLELKVGAEGQQRTYKAASLWHLFVVEPAACREHLGPLLAVFDRQWALASTAEQVETMLLRAAGEGQMPDPDRWAALVKQLEDDRFSQREAADRELRALGRVVFTYLQGLDPSDLDAEQHYRIRRILMTLSASTENDAPPEIASWLAGDPAVWLAMLSRDEESTRRLAAKRLAALLGEPIAFDPGADPAARAKQIEQLRPKVLNR
jgi:hypothetical protein